MADDKEFKQLLIDGLKDMKTAQQKTTDGVMDLTTEFKLHKQESTQRWETVEATNMAQNKLLAEHKSTGLAQAEFNDIERTKIKQTITQDIEPRITTLEAPGKLSKEIKNKIKSTAGWIASVGGAIIIIMKLLGML